MLTRFTPISLRCDCGGRSPAQIRQVGLTAERQLVIQWRCSSCKRTLFSTKSLADYWRECPSRGEAFAAGAKTRSGSRQDYDTRFLHSLGVAMPEGDEA